MPKVFIISESCKGVDDCFICSFVCPKDLFEPGGVLNAQGYLPSRIKDESECIGCGNCMISCPDMAIVVESDKEEQNGQG